MSGRFAGGASAPKAGGVTVSYPETRNGCGRGGRGIFCGVCAPAATPVLFAFRTFVYLFFFCLYPSHFICISTELGVLIKIVLACHLFGCQIVVAKILTFNWFDAKSKLSIFLGMP